MPTDMESEVKASAEFGSGESATDTDPVLEFKKRMLEWPNPVEFVNNMYGCHPSDGNSDYFKAVFGK